MIRKPTAYLLVILAILFGLAAYGQSEDLLDQPYPLRRLIAPEDIRVETRPIRLEGGKKATLVIGSPKKARTAPAVFIIDVETSALAADPVRWFRRGHNSQEKRMKRVRYLLSSPFGSNLLGNGFVVAYLIAEDIESLRSARTSDWLASFERVRKNKKVDPDSFFLLSTREYANLSLYLASHYSFSGVVLEEPHYMLFSKNGYKHIINSSDRMTEEEIWKRSDPSRKAKYQKIFSSIHSPLLLLRAKNTTAYGFNQKTLIPGLRAANTYFEEATFDEPARYIETLGEEGVLEEEPRISYNVASTSIWLEHMLDYFKENSVTEPVELAMPYPNLGH